MVDEIKRCKTSLQSEAEIHAVWGWFVQFWTWWSRDYTKYQCQQSDVLELHSRGRTSCQRTLSPGSHNIDLHAWHRVQSRAEWCWLPDDVERGSTSGTRRPCSTCLGSWDLWCTRCCTMRQTRSLNNDSAVTRLHVIYTHTIAPNWRFDQKKHLT